MTLLDSKIIELENNLNTCSGTIISDCGNYRYVLNRTWDINKPIVIFIMLNPSTADALKDDPTVKKCIKYAKKWGKGGLIILNLFAYRSRYPTDLEKVDDPIGPLNNDYLKYLLNHTPALLKVAAWGNTKKAKTRINFLKTISCRLNCLEISKEGNPKHPLYLNGNLKPKKFIL